MDLNKLCIEARTRNQWEAIDLGVLLTKQLWRPLFVSWAVPVIITYLILILVFSISSWWPYFIIWWLKPLWDRLPLYIVSRALFGEVISAKEALSKIVSLYKIDLLPWITYRRFNISRSLDMPVTILEGLTSQARSKRLFAITRSNTHAASWLTIICLHIEQFLALAIFSFAVLLVPDEFQLNFLSLALDEEETTSSILFFLSIITMCLIAPFYTVAGFCLYINRRIHIEAWDVEIRFRHLAKQQASNRKKTIQPSSLLGTVFLCAVLGLANFSPNDAYADDNQPYTPLLEEQNNEDQNGDITEQTTTNNTIKETIIQVLNGEEFHTKKTIGRWQLKKTTTKDNTKKIPNWFIRFIEWWESLFSDREKEKKENIDWNLAAFLWILVWAAVIGIIAYFIYQFKDYRPKFSSSKSTEPQPAEPPKVLFGLDVRQENLPDDVPSEVLALWHNQDHRGALGLLYRAILAHLMHEFNVKFRESYTEGECLNVAYASIEPATYSYLADITLCWQNLAYGHILPSSESITALCKRWKGVLNHEA